MFKDLSQRAKQYAENIGREQDRRNEVRLLFFRTVKELLPEIEELGFYKVELSGSESFPSGFALRIQPNNSYSGYDFTYNVDISSISSHIHYGRGANSARGEKMEFDYNWNDSKLVGTMHHVLRAVITQALKNLEVNRMREAKKK